MTKEQIQDRIKVLSAEREQLRVNLVAYDGAIQDCNFWLSEIEKKETNGETDAS